MPGTIVRTGNGVVNDTDKDSAQKKKKKKKKDQLGLCCVVTQ